MSRMVRMSLNVFICEIRDIRGQNFVHALSMGCGQPALGNRGLWFARLNILTACGPDNLTMSGYDL